MHLQSRIKAYACENIGQVLIGEFPFLAPRAPRGNTVTMDQERWRVLPRITAWRVGNRKSLFFNFFIVFLAFAHHFFTFCDHPPAFINFTLAFGD